MPTEHRTVAANGNRMTIPLDRYAVQSAVSTDVMCDAAPDVVRNMMQELLRNISPDWPSVRLTVSVDELFHTWMVQLDASGVPRPGGNHGQR